MPTTTNSAHIPATAATPPNTNNRTQTTATATAPQAQPTIAPVTSLSLIPSTSLTDQGRAGSSMAQDPPQLVHTSARSPSPGQPRLSPDPPDLTAPVDTPSEQSPIQNNNSNIIYSSNTDIHTHLVTLRKAFYKLSFSSLTSASHLSYLEECQGLGYTPPGLHLNRPCQAAMKDLTDIEDRFNDLLRETEKNLINLLIQHYKQANIQTEKLLQNNHSNTVQALNLVDQASKTLHENVMQRTNTNIARYEQRLDHIKRSKLNNLAHPRTRPQGPSQYPRHQRTNPHPRSNYYHKEHHKETHNKADQITTLDAAPDHPY